MSANGDLALGRHVNAEAASIVREARVAGDDAVAIDSSETQRIGPVGATIFECDSGPVGGAKQDDTGVEHAPTQRFAANLRAGGDGVPTIAGMGPGPVAAA